VGGQCLLALGSPAVNASVRRKQIRGGGVGGALASGSHMMGTSGDDLDVTCRTADAIAKGHGAEVRRSMRSWRAALRRRRWGLPSPWPANSDVLSKSAPGLARTC
jgi:hypothetical protein